MLIRKENTQQQTAFETILNVHVSANVSNGL